jgi:1-acyl-sn-glycerol-3-phosphate acyltransferase
LAIEAGVPVIPVAMIGTDVAQPVGQKVPSRVEIGVRIGAPIDISAYMGRQDDREALRELTDKVMEAIQKLSGQEYVDRDSAQYKRALAVEKREGRSEGDA